MSFLKKSRQRTNRRHGMLSVEMTFVIPVVLFTFFGLWEWSRVEMIKHVCENAVFEGARMGTLPGASTTDTETKVLAIFDAYLIEGATATAAFNIGTGESTVSVSVPVSDNLTLGGSVFNNKYINSTMTLIQ